MLFCKIRILCLLRFLDCSISYKILDYTPCSLIASRFKPHAITAAIKTGKEDYHPNVIGGKPMPNRFQLPPYEVLPILCRLKERTHSTPPSVLRYDVISLVIEMLSAYVARLLIPDGHNGSFEFIEYSIGLIITVWKYRWLVHFARR